MSPETKPAAPFLFSIDLEDVRSMIPDGERYAPRVPEATGHWLEFLARHDARATFFAVGNVVRRNPDLIRTIRAAGHELACHTSEHLPLDRQTALTLREDLHRNRSELEDLIGDGVVGFRAPIFSLGQSAEWAFDVIRELGFRYSSSVLPATGLLHGWDRFSTAAVRLPSGLWEFPLTTGGLLGLRVPFAGGVYFRLLPLWVLRRWFRSAARSGQPIVSYFHPYDLDTAQERFQHPELGGSRILNQLMYIGRGSLVARLDRLVGEGLRIERFIDCVDRLESGA